MSEMTLEEVVAEQRRTDDAFKGDVLEVNCGGYRQLLALARRALEQAARDEVNDAFLAKVDAALEQPVPTGEADAGRWRIVADALVDNWEPGCGNLVDGIAHHLVAAFQAGRESAQGGWVAELRKIANGWDLVSGAMRLEGARVEVVEAREGLTEELSALLDSLAPPPPSDPNKGGGT